VRQDELAFIKGLSALHMKLATKRKRKVLTVYSGRRCTTSGIGSRTSQQLEGKRNAYEQASSGDCTELANRRPAPGVGSMLLLATTAVTGEQAAASSRQTEPSGLGATYGAVLYPNAAPSQPIGTLKPTSMDSEPSETGVSVESSKRRMSNDMSGPLSRMRDGTTHKAHVTYACLKAGQLHNEAPNFISGVTDTLAFLAWLQAS